MSPTIDERYKHMRANAEAFVEGMKVMVAAAVRDGHEDLATNLKVWCLMPWEAAIRADDSGDLWALCEACGLPIKDQAETLAGEDCEFHVACVKS